MMHLDPDMLHYVDSDSEEKISNLAITSNQVRLKSAHLISGIKYKGKTNQ